MGRWLSEFIGAGICDGCGKEKSQLYGVDAYPVCGANARTTHLEHLRSLLNQCQKANIPPFIKQLGAKPILNNQPYKITDKKGGILSEFPEDLQIREFPNV